MGRLNWPAALPWLPKHLTKSPESLFNTWILSLNQSATTTSPALVNATPFGPWKSPGLWPLWPSVLLCTLTGDVGYQNTTTVSVNNNDLSLPTNSHTIGVPLALCLPLHSNYTWIVTWVMFPSSLWRQTGNVTDTGWSFQLRQVNGLVVGPRDQVGQSQCRWTERVLQDKTVPR